MNSIGFLQFIGLTKSSEEKGIHQNTSKNFLSIYIFSFDANSLSYKTIQNISIFVIKVSAVKVILLSKEVTLLRRKERWRRKGRRRSRSRLKPYSYLCSICLYLSLVCFNSFQILMSILSVSCLKCISLSLFVLVLFAVCITSWQ